MTPCPKAANDDDPKTHFKGKTVRVTGTVPLCRDKPEIKVGSPDQVVVVETR